MTEPKDDDPIDRALAALVAAAGADAPVAPDAGTFRRAQPAHLRRRRPRGVTIAAIVAAAASVVGLVLVARSPESQPGSPTTVAMSSTTSTTRAPTTSVAPVVYAPGWNRLPDPPLAPRSYSISVTIGDEVYVIGGTEYVCRPGDNCALNGRTFADGAAFNLSLGTWRTLAEAPVELAYIDAAVVGSDIFVMEGSFSMAERRLFRYDTIGDEWHEIEVPEGAGAGLEADADRLIVWILKGEFVDTESSGGARTNWLYSPATDQWTALPDHERWSYESRGFCRTEIGLLLVAVRPGPDDTTTDADLTGLVTIDLLAPGTAQWETLTADSPRGWGSTLCLDSKVVVGVPGHGQSIGGVFDLTTRAWSDLPPPPPDPNRPPFAGVVDGAETAYTGRVGGRLIDLASLEWSTLTTLDARTTAATATVGDRLFVMGGQDWEVFDDGGPHGDAWLWVPPTSN